MVIDTPWVEMSDVAASSVGGWRAVWVVVAIAVAFLPFILWKARWAGRWPWWRSVLFVIAWFCVGVPIAAVIAGDTHATTGADDVVSRAMRSRPAMLQSGSVIVDPSDHSAGTSMHAPYQGESVDHAVTFTVATATGSTSRCRGTVTLKRDEARRGRTAPVYARLVAQCAPFAAAESPAAP
ncbi:MULTISPECIES: hypothetical protein [Tsukamurella]|uniref:Uncharacterized protein n=2 Tax=Tsukamurella TaxID=2060 RepID=A0A5C5RWD0_9ACTN|nr:MULTISPECIES: hypothetical protein [Tsukamurella]NMD54796.1 hypothetical protein [Tsukamurella columbiensis]TWS27074.1 hypothetical protein FK530_20590 [Tsukamurella conjunctivitidis]